MTVGTRYFNEYPCPIGTYNNDTGLQSQLQCTPCPAGHYCPSPGLSRGDDFPCNAGKLLEEVLSMPNILLLSNCFHFGPVLFNSCIRPNMIDDNAGNVGICDTYFRLLLRSLC